MSASPPPTHDLNWCFSTLGCAEKDLEGIVELARQFEIERVELRAVSDRLDLPNVFREQFGDAEQMKTWLVAKGITIASLDSSAKLIGCSPEAKQELLDFARWAQPLGIPAIRVFDGGTFQAKLADADRIEAAEFLAWWEDEKKAHHWTVDLIIETHDALCTAAHCLELSNYAKAPVHILWDAHHTWRKGGEDPLKSWSEMKQLVRHVHFKDSVGKPSARHPFTYTNLGEGEFALRPLMEQLSRDGYAGTMSLEWEKKWHPYLEPLENALSQLDTFRNRQQNTAH